MNKSKIKEIIKHYNQQSDDISRFKIITSNSKYFGVFLDNDYTGVYLTRIVTCNLTDEEREDYNCQLNSFHGYLGQSEGLVSLLESLKIDYEFA